MNKNSKIQCSACGSDNIKLNKKPITMLTKIEKLLDICNIMANQPFIGQTYVYCKDCKHETLITIM